jgi:hypothetical protein
MYVPQPDVRGHGKGRPESGSFERCGAGEGQSRPCRRIQQGSIRFEDSFWVVTRGEQASWH